MTAHLIIQRRHGSLSWSIDFAESRTTPIWPAPIARVPLTDADLALKGPTLFDRWVKANLPAAAAPVAAPQVEIAPPAPATRIADEIHVLSDAPGPVRLPDGREIAVGSGLTIITTQRFAEMIEAARFGSSEGGI